MQLRLTATLAAAAAAAVLLLATTHLPASAQKVSYRPDLSCSDWKSVCAKRGGSADFCGKKYYTCTQTGCWTETPQYGSDNWCRLQRK